MLSSTAVVLLVVCGCGPTDTVERAPEPVPPVPRSAPAEPVAGDGAGPLLPDDRGPDTAGELAQPPAAGIDGVARRIAAMEARSASVARPLPDTYRRTAYLPRPLTGTSLPYRASTVFGVDRGVDRDSTGVRMMMIAGRMYDHPVIQAQDALMALSDFRLTGERRYLRRAMLDAQRLVDRRVVSSGAWYLPYPYDFALHGGSTDARAVVQRWPS